MSQQSWPYAYLYTFYRENVVVLSLQQDESVEKNHLFELNSCDSSPPLPALSGKVFARSAMNKLKGLYILDDDAFNLVYGPEERAAISMRVAMPSRNLTWPVLQKDLSVLRDVEVIFSGWGAPLLDERLLDAAPRLKAFFYGAGALGSVWTPAIWDREIVVTSAIHANSVPVAEYALAAILMSLKQLWSLSRLTKQERYFPDRNIAPGAYGSTVGLISLGTTAKALLKMLKPFDLRVVAHDPFLSREAAAELGVELVPLMEVFRQSDVVSLHAPLLPETVGMITGDMLATMKPGATFINTARGEVVKEAEMIRVARDRSDLTFVLDVVSQEPPPPDSELYTLDNIVLTPHIAGSVGRECRRMGRYMVEELERFVSGKPLKWMVTSETARNTSHRPVVRKPMVLEAPPDRKRVVSVG